MEQEEKVKWQIHIARSDSLGGRALRRQLVREGSLYEPFGGQAPKREEAEGPLGLLLPFLEIRQENLGRFIPKVALSLQQARSFDRTVLLLSEPLPEVLSLMERHQARGLQVTAVCAGRGGLYGSEAPEDSVGPVETVLDTLRERLDSASPRKRVLLPCGEREKMLLTYVGDLASAAIFVMRHDREMMPLLVKGAAFIYGDFCREAAASLGFGGRLQFGKEKIRQGKELEGFRTLQGNSLHPLSVVLPYLALARARGGRLKLSACVIMRDNEQDIGRCLASLAAADEIIVVDTGSVDRSIEIAREYTEKIYHFDWIDDFAAARNFALSQATGDWIVFPDSDEFFTEETAANLHQIAEDYDGPGGARELMVRHLNVDKDMRPIGIEGAVSRIFTRGLRYEGKVHEYLISREGSKTAHLNVPRERLCMKHTGYSPERLGAKNARNEKLLQEAQNSGEELSLQNYYMSQICLSQGRYEEALQEVMAARRKNCAPLNLRAELYRTWYKACMGLKDEAGMQEARETMRQEMPNMPDSYALEGVALWNEGREDEAAPLLLKALELSAEFLKLNPREKNLVAEDMPAIARELREFYTKRGEQDLAEKIKNILT